jgi:hypothetical protein
MNKIYYISLILCLIELSSQLVEIPKANVLTNSCFDKLFNNTQFNDCKDAVNKKWNITERATTEESSKIRCCSDWDDIKCLEQFDAKDCTPEEAKATEQYRKDYIKFLEADRCKEWPQTKCSV